MICRWMSLFFSESSVNEMLSVGFINNSHAIFSPFAVIHFFLISFFSFFSSHSIAFTLTQIIRDLGFMIPDLFHFIIPIWLLRKTRRENYSTKPFYRDHKLKYDTLATFFIVTILLLICSFL